MIWAHAGMSEPPAVIAPLMAEHARLYADTSYREHDILRADRIDPQWRALLEAFPERFMVGTDTWVNGRWDNYAQLVATNRRWLSLFPRELAERFAYKNAEALFGITVSRKLLGTR